jgi:hypothetical protein
MQRYRHPDGWLPERYKSYFLYWDKCDRCLWTQMYEEQKRWPDKGYYELRLKPMHLNAQRRSIKAVRKAKMAKKKQVVDYPDLDERALWVGFDAPSLRESGMSDDEIEALVKERNDSGDIPGHRG